MSGLRGSVAAGTVAGVGGLSDRGTVQERMKAASDASHNPVALVLGGALGAGAAAITRAPRVSQSNADQALRGMGVEPAALPAPAKADIRANVAAGRVPEQAAVSAAAKSLPVSVPLTQGDLTGGPGQQLAENLALRGAKGEGAALKMKGFRANQQDALRGNVTAIAEDMGGNGRAGEMVSDALNQRFDASKAGVKNAFDAARETDAFIPQAEGPVLGAHMREGMRDFDLERVPSVGRELNRMDDLSQAGPISARELFDARARLSNLRGSSDAVEATAAGRAVNHLDDYIDDAVSKDLFRGDGDAVAKWREAIGLSREHKNLFEGDDLINKLTERTRRGGGVTLAVDPHDATNYIFGRSGLGFAGRQNLSRDMIRLRSVLGADSPEWNALRAESFRRLAQQGEGGVEGGTRQFSGVKFLKAWQDFKRAAPELANTLFTPEERGTIDQFAGVSARVTAPVKGGDNSSNTAVAALNLLRNLRFLKAVPGARGVVDAVGNVANENAVSAALRPSIARAPRLGSGAPRVGTRAIGVASQQARTPGR
jgi:hypothetical protein